MSIDSSAQQQSSKTSTGDWGGPLGLLVLAAAASLAMGRAQLGMSLMGVLAITTMLVAVAVLTARWPLPALAGLAFAGATMPYLEPTLILGKQLPLLLTIAVIAGIFVVLRQELQAGPLPGQSAAGAAQALPRVPASTSSAALLFCGLLLTSAAITTLRYSPMFADSFLGGISRVDEVGGGFTSIFVLRAAALISGPVLALLLIQFGQRAGDAVGSLRLENWLLAGLLGGLALSLAAAIGQAFWSAFPLPSRDPRWPTGLMTNPGGLATLGIMLLPVGVAAAMSAAHPRGLRILGAASVVLILASLGPLDSKTAQIGVVMSAGIYAAVIFLRRSQGSLLRRAAVAGTLLAGGIVALAGLMWVLAAAGISDWSAFLAESSFGFPLGRVERMRQLLLMFGEHPIAGTGVGTFGMLLPVFYAKYGAPIGGVTYLEATNHLLHMAATGGLLGLGATVWMLFAFYVRPVADLGRGSATGADGVWHIGDAALAGTLAYLVGSNWQGETWYYVPVATTFWFLLATAFNAASAPEWEPRAIRTRTRRVLVLIALAALWLYV